MPNEYTESERKNDNFKQIGKCKRKIVETELKISLKNRGKQILNARTKSWDQMKV